MLGLFTSLALLAAAADPDGGPPEPPALTTVVTGSRSERRLEDTVVATEVIRREDIAATGAQNAAEALSSHVGVELAPSLTTAGQTIRLQGLDSQYVLVLIDGEPAVGRVAGAVDLGRISAEQIDHVEIVKGPSSALYGSDAIAGVVNILTRKSLRPEAASGHAQYGSRNATDVSARAEAERERWQGTFNAGFHRADPWDLDPSTAQTSGPGYSEADFSARADLAAGAHHLTPRAEYLIRDQRGVDASSSGAVLNRRNLTEIADGSLRYGWDAAPLRVDLRGDYSLFRDQFLLDQRGAKDLDQYQATREQQGQLTGQVEAALGPHQAAAGLEGRVERLESPRLSGGEGQRYRAALFASDDWRLLEHPRLLLSPGARLEADSQFGLYPAPKLAARFDPLPELALRAGYGWGYRAPGFKELLLHFENPGVGYVVDGNPDLKPERSQGFTAGVEVQPHPRVWLSVEGYWNALRDLIQPLSFAPASPGAPLQFRYVNVAEARTRGAELALRVRPLSRLSVELGYAFTDARSLPDERPLEGRAAHRGTFQATWRERAWGLEATARGSVTGPRPYYHLADGTELAQPQQTASYATLDARVSKELFGWLSLFAGGTNLLGAGDPTFLPLPPRGFYAGLDVRTPG